MDRSKYVVVGGGLTSYIVVFSSTQAHKDFKHLGEITGAGFVRRSTRTKSGFECVGRSETLDVGVGKDDQFLLDHMLTSEYGEAVSDELAWLRCFYDKARHGMGPADSDVYRSIAEEFRRDGGKLPESYQLRLFGD